MGIFSSVGDVGIYSTIFGGYDTIKGQPDFGVPMRMYTDDPSLRHPQWDVRVGALRDDHPRMAAKYWKLHPHVVFPKHEISIFIDGSMTLTDDFVEQALDRLADADVLLFRHGVRSCIVDEMVASEPMGKYAGQPVREQVRSYTEAGHPLKWGLWASGCIVRRHHRERTRLFDKLWWEECSRWSSQDQLSLPVALRRSGVWLAEWPETIFSTERLTIAQHPSDW